MTLFIEFILFLILPIWSMLTYYYLTGLHQKKYLIYTLHLLVIPFCVSILIIGITQRVLSGVLVYVFFLLLIDSEYLHDYLNNKKKH